MTGAHFDAGHDRRVCGAQRAKGQGACQRPAGWGTDHPGAGTCKLHGGSTPNHRAAARIELARRDVVTFGLPRDIGPAAALLEEVHRTAGHVSWLQIKVAELDEEDLVWGVVEEVDKQAAEFGGTDTTRAAKPNVWLTLYQQERKHLAAVAKAAIDAGCNERLVRLAEEQGAVLASAIRAILADLSLTAEQQAMVRDVVPRHLRALSGAAS